MSLTSELVAIEQLNRLAGSELERAVRDAARAPSPLGVPAQPGAKVYDLVSNQAGEIVASSRENHTVQPA